MSHDRNQLFLAWPAVLEPGLCELIKQLGQCLMAMDAGVTRAHGDDIFDEQTRRTQVGYWDERHWINGLVWHFATLANREIWQFDLTLCAGVQFGTYRPGDFYEWHKDEFQRPYDDVGPPAWRGLNRKMSVVINLTDGSTYTGGDFLLKDPWGNVLDLPELRQQGTVIVFPSYVLHTIRSVECGVRHSLSAWVLGPSFR